MCAQDDIASCAGRVLPLLKSTNRLTAKPEDILIAKMIENHSCSNLTEDEKRKRDADLIVRVASAKTAGDTDPNPLSSFGKEAFDVAVGIAVVHGMTTEEVETACRAILPPSAPWMSSQ